MKKNLISSGLIFLFMALPAFAQWQFNLSTDQSYDNNPFRLPVAEASYMASMDGNLRYTGTQLSISYMGSYNLFKQFSDRNYYWHQLAVFHNYKNGEWGVFINQRINTTDYNIYDFTTSSLYSTSLFTSGNNFFRWYSQLSYDKYNQLSELNNINLYTGLKGNRSFETGTSLIANSGITYKKYTQQNIALSTPTLLTSSAQDMGGHGSGPGSGGMFNNTGSRQFSNLDAPSVVNLEWSLRAAQSLGQHTGLALQYSGNRNLSSQSRNITGLSYSDESALFDDPSGFNANKIGAELTWVLPAGISWKNAFYYADKNYISQGIYDINDQYNQNILRNDSQNSAWSYLSRRFILGNQTTINTTLRYQWLKNSSNSYFYDYQTSSLALGLSLEF